MEFMHNPATDFWGAMRDMVHGPVDATQGSQGRPIAPASDGSARGNAMQSLGDWTRGLQHEGLAGLLDPAGMRDRAAAERELADRFNIIPDGATGTREQNQVTREEFERIAREYSDIRLGRGDLHLGAKPAGMSDADYAAFRQNAMGDIANLLQTESGRGLVDSLAHAPLQADGTSHRITDINARVDGHGHLDNSNANGGGMFGKSGYANYAAGMDTIPSRENIRSDVTLYHELTHAHHAVYNTWDAGTVNTINLFGHQFHPNPSDPDTGLGEFEHQAAGIGRHANDRFSENRYRAERRRIGALNVGERTNGAESDDNMTARTQYSYPGGPRTTPATTMPGAPSGSVGSAGGPGAGGQVGQPTIDND